MTAYADGAEPQMRVYVVLGPDGRPWNGMAFETRQLACSAVCTAMQLYWPQLEATGHRIVPATLRWA